MHHRGRGAAVRRLRVQDSSHSRAVRIASSSAPRHDPGVDTADPQKTWYVFEERQAFSRSVLWELQRQYFRTRSLAAWQQEEVPQYITTNPTVANSYAEIVFGFLRDDERLHEAQDEPLHVCELGAGSGRFAFHFLCRLRELCEQHGLPLDRFRYVLTDLAEANLAFFRGHPRFAPFFEAGVLDTAPFDVVSSADLALQGSGRTIAAGTLARPLVVFANYLFDSVPQDLFHVHEGECEQALVTLAVDEDPRGLEPGELLARLDYRLDYEPLDGPAYEEASLQRILDDYRRTVREAYLSIPSAGLRCLQRMKEWSSRGLLLVSVDKGYHRMAADAGASAGFLRHGSFSLDVNYDAIARFCANDDGIALLPALQPQSVSVSAFLMVDRAEEHVDTQRAYRRHVEEFGPDDFYTLTRYLRKNIGSMALEELLACVRLAHHDATQFARYLPRLLALAPDLDEDERAAVAATIDRVWARYFPLGDASDLAFDIGRLLYELDDYRGAIRFFEQSLAAYGEHAGTLGNLAMCHRMLGEHGEAEALLRQVAEREPGDVAAQAMPAAFRTAVPLPPW